MSVKKINTIVAKHLSYTRNGDLLFSDFSFAITAGSYTAIIGPNGGGKSTLLRILLGLIEPDTGSVKLFGADPHNKKSRARVGYVPQRGGLIDPLFPATAIEVVRTGRLPHIGVFGQLSGDDDKIVQKTLTLLDIQHLKHRTIASLSGGERQRVLLARALATEPDVLMLDEPVDGLDPESREEFYAALRKINKLGTTILFVTHDVHRIIKEADSAICLRHELVCHGDSICLISGHELQNIFHTKKSELLDHHHR